MPPRKKNQKIEATSSEEGLLASEESRPARSTRAAKTKANKQIEAINNNENHDKIKKKRVRLPKKTGATTVVFEQPEIKKSPLDAVENIESKKPAVVVKRGRKNDAAQINDVHVTKRRGKVVIEPKTDYETIDLKSARRNLFDKPANFKISTWNVDGLTLWLEKDKLQFFNCESPDIFCVQDLQCVELPEDLPTFDGYHQYWSFNPYAGVAIFTKMMPYDVVNGIGNESYESGRCMTAEFEKFYIVNVLVPSSGCKLESLSERLEFNKLFRAYVVQLETKKPVIICGDMNVAHENVDVHNPKSSSKKAGFSPEEREAFGRLLEAGYVDTYRFSNPSGKNVYTYWEDAAKARSKNTGWRFDYILVSKQMENAVCDSIVRNQIFGSTHCPVTLLLHL